MHDFATPLRRSPCVLVLLAYAIVVSFSTHARLQAQGTLLAGAASIEITPQEPVPMWGYGDRHAALSEGVLDPLYATALVLQTGKVKLAIVGLDLGRSPIESSLTRIRERIAELGIENSMIAGSHTHHGPVVELQDRAGRGRGRFAGAIRYTQQLEDKIVEAITQANAQLTEAHIATGFTELPSFNRNRHSKIDPIPCDHRLGVLRLVQAEDGVSIATLINFTAHPTSIPSERLQFSADYVGALRSHVEQELGGTAIFMQGASGDISTNRGPFGDHLAYGTALGNEVIRLSKGMQPHPMERPRIKCKEERFHYASRIDFANPIVQGVYSVAFFPELIATFVDEYENGIQPRLTVAMLTEDVAFVGASGEFFCQHAMRLRERARVPNLFFFGYCNGYHQYFPTIEGAAEGGYGADSQVSPVEVGAGEAMMNTALQWLYQMRGKLAP